MIHRIVIPDWRPARDNQLVYKHWGTARRLKRADVEIVGAHALVAGTPRAIGKRRVSLQIMLKGRQKEADPLAYCKSLLDALVKAHLIIDDNDRFMEWGGVARSVDRRVGEEV